MAADRQSTIRQAIERAQQSIEQERQKKIDAAKGKMLLESPNCYPRCSNSTLIRNLRLLNPCIDISVLRTSFPFQDFGKAKELVKLIDVFKGSQKEEASRNKNSQIHYDVTTGEGEDKKTETKDASEIEIDDNISKDAVSSTDAAVSIFGNLYGFISLMSAQTEKVCANIPIFSSPQIRVNNGMGWKKEQSLFGFIQSIISGNGPGSIIGSVLSDIGVNVEGILNGIETIGGMAGWSPRVSPFFSLKDNPFGSTPSLTVELKLINDCVDSVQRNSQFLNTIVRETLIGSATARDGGGETNSRFWMRWYPPKLFNVGLKFGANATSYVKRYHLCTLESTVEPIGVIRNGIPDVYQVNLTFSSLMPDTLDMWTGNDGSFPSLEDAPSSTPTNATTVSGPDNEIGNDIME